ncbi:hypothetical protein LCGC14_0295680 [marine sediment metagenome]|uniref:HD domain-containing protein n=1 Tax=marine sediment metagenome TaxID=412755 RepID=A0A0F9WXJ6_9ZZZZ|nr:deoxyguanosinetriphosphate triphosphohydrolase [Phycisphaerae bacterium]HDZ43022.1 deoxyguanosinetriphosphate triphosphohydrolase [Phycisphaerae bacterium]
MATEATPRQQYEAAQRRWLAPVAVREADSGGRSHDEPPHPYRSCFQRDRDRIIHCTAFRRLDFKTQVFVPHEHDHFRTRLTHTLEVAQVARTIGRALRLNEDLIEAVALAHDLGHPPFGHCGEEALDELMADAGGFEHNRHSLRVVDYLEHPYPAFRGLNLTRAVRECLACHETRHREPVCADFNDGLAGPLEGQVVDVADEIAYTAADLDDALAVGWIAAEDLSAMEIWRRAWEITEADSPDARWIHKRIRSRVAILSLMVDDVVATTGRATETLTCVDDVRRAGGASAAFSPQMGDQVAELKAFLLAEVYEHPVSEQHRDEGRRIIQDLFTQFVAAPAALPQRYAQRVAADGLERVVCDYIAGMTDRYCRAQHAALLR